MSTERDASLTPAPPSAPATAEVRDIIYRLEKVAESFERPPSVQSMANIRAIDTANDAIKMLTSLTAPACAASFTDGVEAIEAARDRYVAAVDPDPHERTAWQSGAIEDGFRLSLAALRALTPPAASQDSGEEARGWGAKAGVEDTQKNFESVRHILREAVSSPETTGVRERAGAHDWIPSTLGHGETMCRHCFVTNREAAVLGIADAPCDKAPRTPDIAATSKNNQERQEELEAFFPTAATGEPSAEEIDTLLERHQAVGDEAAMRERALQTQVTRLTEDLAARTKERDDLSAQVYVPGQWVCAKCKFTLQQMVMSAVDGSVTAQDKPGEPCPNCRSPLWRTTWKQEASEMQERAIEQMEARTAATARADALQQRVGVLEEALKPFANVAELDIGSDESSNDIFRQMTPKYCQAPPITVGDLRRALATSQNEASR